MFPCVRADRCPSSTLPDLTRLSPSWNKIRGYADRPLVPLQTLAGRPAGCVCSAPDSVHPGEYRMVVSIVASQSFDSLHGRLPVPPRLCQDGPDLGIGGGKEDSIPPSPQSMRRSRRRASADVKTGR